MPARLLAAPADLTLGRDFLRRAPRCGSLYVVIVSVVVDRGWSVARPIVKLAVLSSFIFMLVFDPAVCLIEVRFRIVERFFGEFYADFWRIIFLRMLRY